MSYNSPPPSYYDTMKTPSGMMGHPIQTPMGPVTPAQGGYSKGPSPGVEQMRPASGEMLGNLANPYGSKPYLPPPSSSPYPPSSDIKHPYTETTSIGSTVTSYSKGSYVGSGTTYPNTTMSYPSPLDSGVNYSSPNTSYPPIGSGNVPNYGPSTRMPTPGNIGSGTTYPNPAYPPVGSGSAPGYQSMPQPRMPIPGGIGSGTSPGVYPSLGFNQEANPRPINALIGSGVSPSRTYNFGPEPRYGSDPTLSLANRISQVNIEGGSASNYSSSRPYPTAPPVSPGNYGPSAPSYSSPYRPSGSPQPSNYPSPRPYYPGNGYSPSTPYIGSNTCPSESYNYCDESRYCRRRTSNSSSSSSSTDSSISAHHSHHHHHC